MTKPVYNFALSDWFHPPVIHRVDLRRGQTLRIQVHPDDEVMVLLTERHLPSTLLKCGEIAKLLHQTEHLHEGPLQYMIVLF
jgi:hypothetical protein